MSEKKLNLSFAHPSSFKTPLIKSVVPPWGLYSRCLQVHDSTRKVLAQRLRANASIHQVPAPVLGDGATRMMDFYSPVFFWHGKNQKLRTRGKTIQNDQMHQVKRVLAQSVCPFGSLHLMKSRGHREGLDGDAFFSRATMARIEVPVCVGGTGSCHVEV